MRSNHHSFTHPFIYSNFPHHSLYLSIPAISAFENNARPQSYNNISIRTFLRSHFDYERM